MCYYNTVADNARLLVPVSRRTLGAMTGAAGLALLLAASTHAKPITGRDVTVVTPDGKADAY